MLSSVPVLRWSSRWRIFHSCRSLLWSSWAWRHEPASLAPHVWLLALGANLLVCADAQFLSAGVLSSSSASSALFHLLTPPSFLLRCSFLKRHHLQRRSLQSWPRASSSFLCVPHHLSPTHLSWALGLWRPSSCWRSASPSQRSRLWLFTMSSCPHRLSEIEKCTSSAWGSC